MALDTSEPAKPQDESLPDQPLTPKRGVFYGWVVVAVAMVDGAFSVGAGVWGFSVFVIPMGEELGWSRASIYAVLTIRSLLTGVLAPIIGPMQDTRRGPRILAVATTVTMSASMMSMIWVDNLLLFYILFGGLGALASFGSSEMLMSAVLPKWFIRRRGRAIGIASMGTAMGPIFFPALVTVMLSVLEWRQAWFAIGVFTLILLLPMSLLVRTRPEDMGLEPDDASRVPPPAPTPGAKRRMGTPPSTYDFTRKEVVRLPVFWLLILAFSLTTLGIGGFHSNWIPYFQDIGFSRGQGAMAATAYGICSLCTRILWGWLAERYPVRYLFGAQAALTALSVVFFLQINSIPMLIAAGGMNGLVLGGNFVLRPLLVANYFGRGNLGSINGTLRPFITIASASSPLLVAWLYGFNHDYEPVFWVIAVCWLAAAVILTQARAPQPKVAPASPS